MVSELVVSGLYFSQSMRGEIVSGITVRGSRRRRIQLGSRLEFLHDATRASSCR